MRFHTLLTEVRQNAPECEIVHFNMEKVRKMRKTIDDGHRLLINIKNLCINKDFLYFIGFWLF